MRMRAADFSEGDSSEPSPHAVPSALLPEVEEPPHTPRSIWLLAAIGAALIHAGWVALAFEYLQPDDASDDLGAPAIEIGLELEAPHHDPSDLPPGPDADASAASTAVMEQKTVTEQTALPKETPTETDDPDRLVAPQETKKPEDDRPKTPEVRTAPSQASVAAEATAMPSLQTAHETLRSVAPDPGSGENLRRVRATWQKELAVHLDKFKRYPSDRSRQSAEIVIRFVLDRTGRVVSVEVAKSSGDAAFDDAALAMMRRADPVPAPPALITDEGLRFTMPVIFHVKGRG